MSLFKEIENIKKNIDFLMYQYPEWIPISTYVAKYYGYSINGFRNYCLTNINPDLVKKFGKQFHIHKSALPLLKKK